MQRVGASTIDRRDIWQTNAPPGICLGYLKGQLNMFNQVMEKWGTSRLKLDEHWPEEEAAMAECSQRELRTVAKKQLRDRMEAW